MAVLIIIVPAVILALLDIAALRWGADSRYGFGDDRTPLGRVGLRLR